MSDIYECMPAVPRWFDTFRAGETNANGHSAETAYGQCRAFMIEQAIAGGKTVFVDNTNIECLEGTRAKFEEWLKKNKYRMIVRSEAATEGLWEECYVSSNSAIFVNYYDDRDDDFLSKFSEEDEAEEVEDQIVREHFTVHLTSWDREQLVQLFKLLKDNVAPPKKFIYHDAGSAFVLADVPMQGLQLVQLGIAGEDLRRENYMPNVVRQYDEVIADIMRIEPFGQLTVLEGPPGTGKTHMIQAIMKACAKSKFVIVPPKLLSNLEDPGTILTYAREAITTGYPLVLVLEDADKCLSERKSDNINSISAILNLSDGIIGKLLNFRIIASTNTPVKEEGKGLDRALLRKGRLSQHIQMGQLDATQARKCWNRIIDSETITPTYETKNGQIILADVYAAAKEFLEKRHGILR